MALGDKQVWVLGEPHLSNEDAVIIWTLGAPYVVIDTVTVVGDIDTPAKRRMAAGIIPFHSVIIPDGTIGLKDRMQIACLYSENAVAILVGIPIHFMYYQRLRRN